MLTEIWCRQDYNNNIKAKRIWVGDMPVIPRVGEHICLKDGYASDDVKSVTYLLNAGVWTAKVSITSDYEDVYVECEG